MSAGFDVDGEVFWGTNGAIEAYVQAIGAVASELFGADDQLAIFFRGELEGFFPGKVVFLDECLASSDSRSRFLQVLDEASTRLLGGDTFTEYGRTWVATTITALRVKLVQLEAQR